MHEINITREVYNEWLRLLESGEVQQGTEVYFNAVTQRYCSLGVLKLAAKQDNDGYLVNLFTMMDIEKVFTPITKMNDSGKTFPEIAKWIRENVTPVG